MVNGSYLGGASNDLLRRAWLRVNGYAPSGGGRFPR